MKIVGRAEWDLAIEAGELVLAHEIVQGTWKLDGMYD